MSAGRKAEWTAKIDVARLWRFLLPIGKLAIVGLLIREVLREPPVPPGTPLAALPKTAVAQLFERPETSSKLLIGALITGCLFWLRPWLDRWLAKVPAVLFDFAWLVVGFFAVKHVTVDGFGSYPHIQDEIAYDLIGRRMAIGDVVPLSDPLGEFWRIRFMVDDGKNYPLFQPGWPYLLSLFYRLGHAAWAPAFATAVWVAATSRFASRVFGRTVGLLAGLCLLGSGFAQVIGGTFFAHAWAAALFMIVLDQLVAADQAITQSKLRTGTAHAIAAGLAFAWLVLTRLPTALGVTIPAALLLTCRLGVLLHAAQPPLRRFPKTIFQLGWSRHLLIPFCLVALMGPVLQGAWNLRTTGHVLELPQDRYFDLTEPKKNCHRIGFGEDVGCPREHPPEVTAEGYTLARAVTVSSIRWWTLRNDAWGSPIPIALAALLVLRRARLTEWVIAAAAFAPFAVYFGFYYHGNQWGARLWTEMMGPLAVACAAGVLGLVDLHAAGWQHSASATLAKGEPRKFHWPRPATWLAGLLALPAGGLLYLTIRDEFGRDIPQRRTDLGSVRHPQNVSATLDAANIHNAVLYVANCLEADRHDVAYGWSSVLNSLRPALGDRIFVRDFGPEHDQQLAARYPFRRHIRVDCVGHPIGEFSGPWRSGKVPDGEVPFMPKLDHLVTEAEAKSPPDQRSESLYAFAEGVPGASNGAVLVMKTKGPGGFATFRQYIPMDGNYNVSLQFVQRTNGGHYTLLIDGQRIFPDVDGLTGYATKRWESASPLQLSAGTHVMELRSRDTLGNYTTALDRWEFRRVR